MVFNIDTRVVYYHDVLSLWKHFIKDQLFFIKIIKFKGLIFIKKIIFLLKTVDEKINKI